MRTASVAENTGHADDYGGDHDDEPDDNDHGTLRRFTLLLIANAGAKPMSTP